MKYRFRLAVLFAALSFASSVLAADEAPLNRRCYAFRAPHLGFVSLEARDDGATLVSIEVRTLTDTFTDAPGASGDLVLRGRCTGTQGGGETCEPDVVVPVYHHFQDRRIRNVYFHGNYGALGDSTGLDHDFVAVACAP